MKEKTKKELLLEVQELRRQLELQAQKPESAQLAGKLARLASFPQLNPNPVLEVDAAGTVTFYNTAASQALEKLGLAGEVNRFLPEDLSEILAAAKQEKQDSFYREIEIKDAVYGENIHYAQPYQALRLYTSDITERKRAEAALVDAKEEWELTFNAVPDLITILDKDHGIVRVNRAMAEALGMTPEEMPGRRCYECMHKTAAPPSFCPHSQLLADGQEHTAELPALGRDFLVTASPLKDRQGDVVGSVHVARDITERKQGEAALKQTLAESRQRQKEVTALLEAARAVMEHRQFTKAARAIFDACKDLIGATSGYMALLSKDGTENELLFLEAGGLHCTVDPALPMPIRGLRAEAYRLNRTVFDNDFSASEYTQFLPPGHVRLDNVLFAPLTIAGRTVGLMGLANKPGGFTADDARLAAGFGELAAVALLNKQAEEALQQAHDELERRVEERTGELRLALEQLQWEITERQQAEEALREQSRLLEAFFTHSFTPLVFLDRDCNFIRVNEAYARACQKKVDEFPGHNHFEFYPHPENEAIFAEVVKTKTPYQAIAKPFTFPDHPERGVSYWDWTLTPILDEGGEVDFMVFSLVDVTERVRSEEVRNQLVQILEATPDFVATADRQGQVLYINAAGRRMVSMGLDEDLSGYTVREGHPESARTQIMAEALPTAREKGMWQGETELLTRDGRVIPVSQVILAHRTASGETAFYSTICRDISERQKAEAALRESEERLRFLTAQLLTAQEEERRRLSRELHDELGQSLLVLKLQLRGIQNRLADDDWLLKKDVGSIRHYLDQVIDEVRRLSRDLSPSILEDLGLSTALRYLFEEFGKHYGIDDFSVDIDKIDDLLPKEFQINIFRIFQETLTNIGKHAGPTRVAVSVKKEAGSVSFSVADNGAGFDWQDILARQPQDKGMGLAAMEERVRMLDGTLHIWSKPGQGTKITWSIPTK